MPVVVDEVWVGRVALDADLVAEGSESGGDAPDGPWHEAVASGAGEDLLGEGGVWLGEDAVAKGPVPWERAATDDDLGAAWDDIEDLAAGSLVGDGERGVEPVWLCDDDLSIEGRDARIVHERAGAESGAVDDVAGEAFDLVECVESAPLDRVLELGEEPGHVERGIDAWCGEGPGVGRAAGVWAARVDEVLDPLAPPGAVAGVLHLHGAEHVDAGARVAAGQSAEPAPGGVGPADNALAWLGAEGEPDRAGDGGGDGCAAGGGDHTDGVTAFLQRERRRQADDARTNDRDLSHCSRMLWPCGRGRVWVGPYVDGAGDQPPKLRLRTEMSSSSMVRGICWGRVEPSCGGDMFICAGTMSLRLPPCFMPASPNWMGWNSPGSQM